jgi:hypothetical protein
MLSGPALPNAVIEKNNKENDMKNIFMIIGFDCQLQGNRWQQNYKS